MLFGLEDSGQKTIKKAYLEFGGRFDNFFRSSPGKEDSFTIHLGFKWDAADNTSQVIAKYICFPLLSPGDIEKRIATNFYSKNQNILALCREILRLAASRPKDTQFLFFEAQEASNPRQSFDINLYQAKLQMETLFPILTKMCEHYTIPLEKFTALCESIKNHRFGHLTGGVDRSGRDFATVYYGIRQ